MQCSCNLFFFEQNELSLFYEFLQTKGLMSELEGAFGTIQFSILYRYLSSQLLFESLMQLPKIELKKS